MCEDRPNDGVGGHGRVGLTVIDSSDLGEPLGDEAGFVSAAVVWRAAGAGRLRVKSQRQPIARLPAGRGTTVKTPFATSDSISESIAACQRSESKRPDCTASAYERGSSSGGGGRGSSEAGMA